MIYCISRGIWLVHSAPWSRPSPAAQDSANESALAAAEANLGMVLVDRGVLGEAERNYREALGLERKLGSKSAAGRDSR